MSINRDALHHLAKLSALQLSDDELDHLWHDLEWILQYVAQLQEIDTTWIESLSHPIAWMEVPMHEGVSPYADPDGLLQNVSHQINHKHVVITSKKAEEN